ncbi:MULTISPECIES: xylulokinase [unclassified Vibrio]|uniref:xylulokinase n=1 Tax=unclassified Vibrio TaxID=2614977 RepID=UPI00159DA4EE|nr:MULTISPECIES: xylulokinase [unclassified Vibrio]NVN80575.1 xylulokinase [Vibrio sp. Scap16]QLE95611.1 xylulokinase [Vibrio sp. Scap24]
MYIGIDLGTSGVKSIAMSKEGEILASKTVELSVSRTQPLWSEQNPNDWWEATAQTIKSLSEQVDLKKVKAIGLSGQMHGATLLDANGEVLRPAILWNDGRCEAECQELEALVPESRQITGNIIMPGFTAPKLKWVANHEPEVFAKIDKVLLPKDYLRFKMTNDFASDMSDSAGTCWLDVNARNWSDEMLAATGLGRTHMPRLVEGNQITGHLTQTIADEWGMECVPVIAGGGDNAAGAVGVGITQPGQAMLSLGTSGVYFAVSDGFVSNPASALHSFCHALPNTWHTMSVILSAASCLKWVSELTGFDDVGSMLEEVEVGADINSNVVFLPYLSGERTPINDPNAKGVFFGMTHSTTRLELAQAVLEGVGFAFADGFDALHVTKMIPEEVSLIGGGARSAYWRQMLADIVGMPLVYRKGGDVGPALGAARLAVLGVEPEADLNEVCPVPELVQRHEPNEDKRIYYKAKRDVYQALYPKLKSLF